MSEAELATIGTYNTTISGSSSSNDQEQNGHSDDADTSQIVVSDLEPDSPELGAQTDVTTLLPTLSVATATASVSQAEAHAERGQAAASQPSEYSDTLEAACQAGDLRKVEQLLTPENLNNGALHHAAASNHWRLCKLLLARNADVNRRLEPLDATPLMWACRNGHAYIVKLLLDHGADVKVTDSTGFTPLHLAVQSSNVLMVAYIAHLEVNVDELDSGHRAPLHWAVVQNDHLTVEVLLKAGASPNLRDGEGVYPLHQAVYTSRSADIVTLLLQHGADPFATLPDGSRVVDPENAPDAWKLGCENCGRLPSGLPRRSRLLSPELAKCISSVAPFVVISLTLNMTRLSGTVWLGVPLGIALLWGAKRVLEQWIVPICWPHPKPLMHSTVLAGTFVAVFALIVLLYVTQVCPSLLVLHPWEAAFILADMVLIGAFFISTLMMDPGVIEPRSMAVRLRNMNSLMDEGLFDSVHFCVHTYVVIPVRAQYDYYLERVVCRYDHYCPWVYNAVGIRNHRSFMAFLLCLTIGAPLAGKHYTEYSRTHEISSFAVGLFILSAFQMLWVTMLAAIQVFQIARGTTSFEITHFKKSMLYRTDPLKAFSSLPVDHPKAPEVLRGGQPNQQPNQHQHDGEPNRDSGGHGHSHGHSNGHKHHHHGSKWLLCFKLFGIYQLIVASRVLMHKSTWNKADNGIFRNLADFWCAGGSIWKPDGAQGAVGGVIVDYSTLRDLPTKDAAFRETEQMLA